MHSFSGWMLRFYRMSSHEKCCTLTGIDIVNHAVLYSIYSFISTSPISIASSSNLFLQLCGSRRYDIDEDSAGHMAVGGVDTNTFQGNMFYTPIIRFTNQDAIFGCVIHVKSCHILFYHKFINTSGKCTTRLWSRILMWAGKHWAFRVEYSTISAQLSTVARLTS